MKTSFNQSKLTTTLPNSISIDFLKERIKKIDYYNFPDSTMTICKITLDNDFEVTGEASCVDPSNFDKEIGEKIAYENAFNKLWLIYGFLLKDIIKWNK